MLDIRKSYSGKWKIMVAITRFFVYNKITVKEELNESIDKGQKGETNGRYERK